MNYITTFLIKWLLPLENVLNIRMCSLNALLQLNDTGVQAVLRVSGIVWGQRSVFGPFQMSKICEIAENLVVICSIRSYKSVKLYENFAKKPSNDPFKKGED